MTEWTKVVTNPLGLGGFALFLVFSYLARTKRKDERRWIVPVAIGLAATALVAGLALAWTQVHLAAVNAVRRQTSPPPVLNCQPASQSSTGAASPNVNCVQGPVTITVDQSSGMSGDEAKPRQNKKGNAP